MPEPELHFAGEVVVPDLAGWRRERLPEFPDVAYLELAPDWVCEVLSPSTERIDRGLKMRTYARAGVGHLWLLNPEARTLEVLRLQGENWLVRAVYSGDETIREEPFEAVELDPTSLWGEART